jgi:predicted ATPase/DNA-binding CsgD family transcriptional regulator
VGGSGPGPGSGAAYTPGSRIAGYRLEEEIGAGGMAVVFRARDDRLDRLVALKLLTPWLAADEDFRHRFLRESRAAAAVDDPHIIPVYEAGEAGGVLYLAMRYVSGGDIRSRLRRDGPFTAARAAGVLSPVASALDAAHAAGLVHRDVKPANVLVDSRPGRPDHVYLSDFGLAKTGSASVRLTRTGLNLGTVSYMAPEQIEGREVDGRADQYALACAAFELLAGVVPFERDQDVAVLYAHLSEPPPSLAARRPGVPAAADEVLARALAKAADDRYPTCRHFTDALRQAFGLPPYDHDPGLSPPAAGGPPAAAPALVTGGPPAPAPAAPAPGPHGAPATQIASQRPGSVPAGASASSPGRGSLRSGRVLASPLTTFVGRTEAVQEVAGLLQGSRLVTVTGPGGVGKTRLAIEVARQQAGRFADGACLVELAAVSEPALVPATVAAALGIPQAPDLSATESLAATLHRLQVLLVLDNCEHLIPAVADLCELLLPVADDARFLATSQEPLRAGGETRYRLAPLSVPRPGEQAEAAESEAVRLFTDRARRVDPHFDLDPESAAAVARVVARLDGMPLAIELAAARVEALGLTQLLNRLDDRFALLASGDRRASARQRSLAATVDWSYQLLDGEEQQVFRRLSVIPGPFTLEATTAVAGPGAESAVLRLVDCSLLSPPRVGRDGRPRYLMLETLRAYGAGRLAAAGEQQAAAARLAEHALALATQAAAELQTSAGELAAARWLDTEDATTQQALAWALEHDPGLALRLAVALASWWVTRGRVTAGYPLLLAAAEGAPRAGEAQRADDAWAAAQYWLGYFANLAGDFLGALKHYALAISAVADDPRSPVLADATSGRANCLLNLRRNAEAAEEAERALDLARDIRYPAGEARALLTLSIAAQYAGDEPKALDWARQATRIDPRAIPGRLARQCNDTLADILVDVGDLAAAEDTCVTELDRARQAGDLISQSFCLDLLAELDQRTGRIAEAGTHLRESLEIATRIGNRLRLIDCLNNCGHLCAATGRPADAVTIWAAFVTCLKEIGMSDLPAAQERRREPLRAAQQALGPDRTDAAEKRGREMTLATAAELATLLAGTDARAPEVVPDLGKLSAKERELVTLVAQGRTDAEIAGQLHLTVRTVRSRVDRIRAKAGCPRRADLIRLALQAGLV